MFDLAIEFVWAWDVLSVHATRQPGGFFCGLDPCEEWAAEHVASVTHMQPIPEPSLLVVSPVRNEAPHIERVVQAVATQELPPARWVVIDDGSTDGTSEILRRLAGEIPFLETMSAPPDGPAEGARDRLARAAEVRNFNLALEHAGWDGHTHVMKLDGDIELPPHYLRVLLERFARDPLLGLAGGVLTEPTPGGGTRRIQIPAYHVHGALKCWSRACFTAIGGVQERLGWDTIDETYARMRSYRTRSFPDLVSLHHRPVASADGALRGHARHGECAYISHYDPLWVTLRSLKVARRRPVGLSGAAFLYGYARAGARRVERVPDPDYRRFTRRELRGRMLGAVGWAGAGSDSPLREECNA
jgi:poly-beta-1,6-N-acetyl-D-glucosamine synthase